MCEYTSLNQLLSNELSLIQCLKLKTYEDWKTFKKEYGSIATCEVEGGNLHSQWKYKQVLSKDW